jgi:hypothetical protein
MEEEEEGEKESSHLCLSHTLARISTVHPYMEKAFILPFFFSNANAHQSNQSKSSSSSIPSTTRQKQTEKNKRHQMPPSSLRPSSILFLGHQPASVIRREEQLHMWKEKNKSLTRENASKSKSLFSQIIIPHSHLQLRTSAEYLQSIFSKEGKKGTMTSKHKQWMGK